MSALENRARNVLSDVIYGVDTLDMDTLRETAMDGVHEAAESAVIYHHWALEIIQDYESHPAAASVDSDADNNGRAFKATEWREAMTAYAYYIAYAVIAEEVEELLGQVEERAGELLEAIPVSRRPDDVSALRVSFDCPHGWAAHDGENGDGVLQWSMTQLDGCDAVAVNAGPFWLSYTWTP